MYGDFFCQPRFSLHVFPSPVSSLLMGPTDDEMRINFWSYRGHWKDVGDFGGIILPLEEALDEIATNEIFWTWTWANFVQSRAKASEVREQFSSNVS